MKVGDVVQLKSGGPNMTVDGFFSKEDGQLIEKGFVGIAYTRKKSVDNDSTFVWCKWFDNKSEYKQDAFKKEMLEVIE